MLRLISLGLGLAVTVATLLPLFRQEDWWIRIFDFPRLQIFVLGVVALGLVLTTWVSANWFDRACLAALVVALGIQGYGIIRYTPLGPTEVVKADDVPENASISLLVANVLKENQETGKLISLIREWNPDLVLTLEPDKRWEREMRSIEEDYPHVVRKPLDNLYGMMLYSRLELVEPHIRFLVEDHIPSIHTRVRLRNGKLIWLHCLHPSPPNPRYADDTEERDAELLLVGKEVKQRRMPTIVAGDLNDVAWSYTTRLFQKISGLLDPRKGRGMYNSYHAQYPVMRWPLDHVFHSEHFKLLSLARLPAFGSDHFPVYVRLVLQPGAKREQEAPEASAADKEEAEEKIEKGR